MVLNEKKIKKLCCFYASDFHLEMILLPYITEKLKEEKNIKIITEDNLEESIHILLSKLNIEKKQEILDIDWSNKSKNISMADVIIVNGNKRFVDTVNSALSEKNDTAIIINCFKFEEVKDDMFEINNSHDGVINALKNSLI